MSETINISPGVGILSVFRYIKYKPWYALAEYIDNAIDSYQKNKNNLNATYPGYRLLIDIEFNQDENYIKVHDNAAGINANDLERAFRMAVPPPDRTGLSEFGIGMKAASCWFSPKWSIETQALGDEVKRKVIFDVNSIVSNQTNVLNVSTLPSVKGAHFTNIHLTGIYSMPTKHTLVKIREHLASIYRAFLRDDSIILTINNKQLTYKAPAVLIAPPFSDKSAEPVQWRKELDFVCAGGQRIFGFAAIYATASTKEAGFALLRRGRVVEGSFEEGYRPEKIFANTNSFYYQRIFGELNLDAFTTSFTKDSVQWEDAEDDFLTRLKSAMKSPGLDLLKQANGMRVKDSSSAQGNVQTNKKKTEGSNSGLGDQVREPNSVGKPLGEFGAKSSQFENSNEKLLELSETDINITPSLKITSDGPSFVSDPEISTLTVSLNGVNWHIYIELSRNPAHTDWLSINSNFIPEGASIGVNERQLGMRISLAHPFTIKYCASVPSQLEPLIRLGAAFALARVVAKEGGATYSSVLIDYINELLLKL